MRIGIYVGSFNPVHKGHVTIAQKIIEKDLVDQLWVIVTGNYWDKQDLLPIEDRIRMWKFYQNERIIINETYNHIDKTYQLFRQLKKDYPAERFFLVIGADNLVSFDRWVHYKELLRKPFILVKRDENGEDEIKEMFAKFNKKNYTILNIPVIDISSTYIRNHLDDYEQIKDMIDEEVYQYLLDSMKK